MPDPQIFFWIAASVAETAAINPNSTKILLVNGVSTFFVNGKSTPIDGARKLSNPPFSRIIFPVVPLNKIPLFPKEIITFTKSFI